MNTYLSVSRVDSGSLSRFSGHHRHPQPRPIIATGWIPFPTYPHNVASASLKKAPPATATGSLWRFLKLDDTPQAFVDIKEYYIDNLSRIMGILREIVGE